MAKGVEDTAFTVLTVLSLNEVGGDPDVSACRRTTFIKRAETQAEWPRSMLASSTHDTKRSEDVRARLHLLSEIPDRWRGRAAMDNAKQALPPRRFAGSQR